MNFQTHQEVFLKTLTWIDPLHFNVRNAHPPPADGVPFQLLRHACQVVGEHFPLHLEWVQEFPPPAYQQKC